MISNNKRIPRWYHLVGFEDESVHEVLFVIRVNGALYFEPPRWLQPAPGWPRWVALSQIAWAIPVIKDAAHVAEYMFRDELAEKLGDSTNEVFLPPTLEVSIPLGYDKEKYSG